MRQADVGARVDEGAPLLPHVADRLTIGQMARLNATTEKTLRLYQRMGLLVPSDVDEANGYRYYTVEQSLRFDRIQHLQHMGFTLREIGPIIGQSSSVTPDLERSRILKRKLAEVEARIVDLAAARDSLRVLVADSLVNRTAALSTAAEPTLVWRPARRLLVFNVRSRGLELSETASEAGFREWYLMLRDVRCRMKAAGVPLGVYDSPICSVAAADFEAGSTVVTDVCFSLPEEAAGMFEDEEVIPAGYYLAIREEEIVTENGAYGEFFAMGRLLATVRERGWSVRGRYLGEGNILDPVDAAHRAVPLTFQIPVDIG